MYPFYVGAFSPLSLFVANLDEVHGRDLAAPLTATLLLTLILLGSFAILLGNKDRGGADCDGDPLLVFYLWAVDQGDVAALPMGNAAVWIV